MKIALIALLLAGCTYGVTSADINKAVNLCENNGGVSIIYVFSPGRFNVDCMNGASFREIER